MGGSDRAQELPARRRATGRAGPAKQRGCGIPHSTDHGISQPPGESFTQILERLKPHDHLCLLYQSREEWRAAAVPFISIGLKRGEKCIYVVDSSTAAEIRAYLGEEGVDVAAVERSGQLSVLHETEAYTREGTFDPERMIALLTVEAEKALAEGYPALRVTGEMTWVLRGHPGSERLEEYEARLNSDFFPKYPCLAICQYDRGKFDPEIIQGVILTHPLLIQGNRVYHNFYYIPPQEFLSARRVEAEVQRQLDNLEREEQIREALQREKDRAERYLDTADVILVVIDSDQRVSLMNKKGCQVLGCRAEEIIGKNWFDNFLPERYRKEAKARFNKLMAGNIEAAEYFESPVLAKSGEERLIVWHNTLLIDRQGIVGILSSGEDITERRQAEERVRHLNAVLRALRNINQIITREKDSQSLIERSCELLIETRGYALAVIVLVDENGDFISAAGAGDISSQEAWSALLKQLKRGDYPRCFSETLKRDKPFAVLGPDAEECQGCDFAPFRVSDTSFIDRLEYGGRVYGMILVRLPSEFAQNKEEQGLFHELVGDISFALHSLELGEKRQQVEEALRESEERYRAILELGEQAGEAVVMLQDDARGEAMHVFASEVWSKMTGYSREELLNMSMAELIHPRDRKAAMERHQQRMRGRVLPGLYEMTIIRKDGSELPVEVTYAPSSYKGKPANVGYIRNISERKKMQEQLLVTDRLASIGELASGVAHELNNPLTSVIGFSDLLLRRAVPDDVKQDLKMINSEAQRAAQIVRNLLTFARRHPEEKEPVDINKAVQNILEMRAYEQKVNNIEVRTDFAADLPEVIANSFQLQQVFLNIIINAEYFMKEAHDRGTLIITTERAGDFVRISFADDGPGIPPEIKARIFAPFFTTKEVGKGTGLGLSICQGIIAEHGGRIYAESEPGRGAIFIVELPVPAADSQRRKPS